MMSLDRCNVFLSVFHSHNLSMDTYLITKGDTQNYAIYATLHFLDINT